MRKNKKRVLMMLYSFIFVGLGTLPMFFLSSDFRYPIYILAFIIGIGFSQGLATVSSLINDVVGCKGAQGAFVYGAYSLLINYLVELHLHSSFLMLRIVNPHCNTQCHFFHQRRFFVV